jgi:hypothetical protein
MALVRGLERIGKDQEGGEGILRGSWAGAKNNWKNKKWMKLDCLFKQNVGYRDCLAKSGRENR